MTMPTVSRTERFFCWFIFFSALIVFSRAGISQLHSGGVVDEASTANSAAGNALVTWLSYSWLMILPFFFLKILNAIIGDPILKLVGAVGLYFLASSFWSALPFVALKESFRVLLLIGAAIAVGKTLSLDEILYGLMYFCGTLTVISAVLAIAFPEYGLGVGMHSGAWVGVFGHKNHFGRFCAFSGMVFSLSLLLGKGYKPLLALFLLGLLVCTYLSRSTNSLILLLVIVLFIGISRFFHSMDDGLTRTTYLVWIGIAISLMVLATFIAGDHIYSIIGKTEGLSGRSAIWEFAFKKFLDAPILGYGLGVFWSTHRFIVAWGDSYVAPHAHNGYLELLLDGGLAGFSLVMFFYLAAIFKSSRAHGLLFEKRLILTAVGALIFVGSIAETTLFKPNYFLFVFLTVYCCLAMQINILFETRTSDPSTNSN